MMPESVFSIGRNRRSRSTGIRVHDGPERAKLGVADREHALADINIVAIKGERFADAHAGHRE
jgi:hypothetical protein